MTISTIIVTYNRENDFLRCLNAVLHQTKHSNSVVIVNNASTDNTLQKILEFLELTNESIGLSEEKLILLKVINETTVYILNKGKNTGGSGGFYSGLKAAHEQLNSDFYWLMDDDGYPTENCLQMLISEVNDFDYIMPTSIDISDHTRLSWPTRMKNGRKTAIYDDLKASWGKIMNFVTPFNGILLSRKCVDEVGYINKDFFLWGDEYDHYWRCKEKGFEPVTLLGACFYHPAQKLPLVKIFFGLFSVPYVDSPLRMICLVRNGTYIFRHYKQWYKIPIKWIMYWWLFIITRHGDFDGWKLYKSSVKDGFREDFTRHLKYLK